jgi:hypothetical protein
MKDGDASLMFRGKDGAQRVSVGITKAGLSGAFVFSKQGQLRSSLACDEEGNAGLSLYQEQNRLRGRMTVDTEGSPTILFKDIADKPVLRLP